MPKLSVIVPLYNSEQYIEQCIKSIQNQSYRDIQIIIVDDGSTDNGVEICRKLSKEDGRIKIIQQENQGLLRARYTGLVNCETEYATFVDADDFISEESYIYSIDAMENDVDMIMFEISRYYNERYSKREKSSLPPGYYDRKRIEKEAYSHLFWGFEKERWGIECSLCVRIVKTHLLREQYKKVRKYKFYFGEDAAVSYPLFLYIKDMEMINRCYYMHRQRAQKKCPPYITDESYFEKVYELYQYLKSEFSTQPEEYNFLQQLDYYYMYMVNNKKKKYDDSSKEKYTFLFPFNRLPQNKVVLLYGAGGVGKDYYNQIREYDFCKKIIWVDKNAEGIGDKRVVSSSNIPNEEFDYVIVAHSDASICKEIEDSLVSMGIKREIIYSTVDKKGE